MKINIIIALIVLAGILALSCETKPTPKSDDPYGEPEIINDKHGFLLMDLGGFVEDKDLTDIAWNNLTLRKGDARVQFGVIKGAKFSSKIPGIPALTEKKMLYEWTMGMLMAPKFYPGTNKAILNSAYIKVEGKTALVLDILLEFDREKFDALQDSVLKTNKEEIQYLINHKRAILRTHHFYRGDDLFHIELLAEPLTYNAETANFSNTIIRGLKLKKSGRG